MFSSSRGGGGGGSSVVVSEAAAAIMPSALCVQNISMYWLGPKFPESAWA